MAAIVSATSLSAESLRIHALLDVKMCEIREMPEFADVKTLGENVECIGRPMRQRWAGASRGRHERYPGVLLDELLETV